MKRRIGTDFFIELNIIDRLTGDPYDLEKAQDLTVVVQDRYKKLKIEKKPVVDKGSIKIQISSIDNIKIGLYNASVFWAEESAESETGRLCKAVDFLDIFEIVPISDREDNGGPWTGTAEGIAKNGLSSYEIWKNLGNEGNQNDFLDYLRAPAKAIEDREQERIDGEKLREKAEEQRRIEYNNLNLVPVSDDEIHNLFM